ncbi:hypothetical protein NPIL_39691 [Nephila pilipes]|uniref:Uncharacterized protein n=1 Tax=Nephila pilipes TaxID=299642 RepID=A0A8X6TIY7_NEPPI|nr:hypothetical protein NPIL_39691 [Nephila pilipes]
MNDAAGADEFSRLFSQSAPVGKYLTNFDVKVHAIFLTVTNLQSLMGYFEKAVILVDSRSAIETLALQHLSESLIESKIIQVIWELIMNGTIPMDIITCGHR